MKIAINELGGSEWTGGVTYRRNLIKALCSHPEKIENSLAAYISSKVINFLIPHVKSMG